MGAMARGSKYPSELRERAVRMVFETRQESGDDWGSITSVGNHLGIHKGTLSRWVIQAEVDRGTRSGLTTDERLRLAELEKENRELRRANEILKAASAFFAAELDRPQQS